MIATVYNRQLRILHTFWTLIRQEQVLHQNSKTMAHADKLPKAKDIVHNHVGFAMGAALVPFPAADLLAVSAVQLNMLRQLAKLYQVSFFDTLGKNVISAVATSGAARLGASLVKAIPGVGTVIGELSMPVLSGGSTYALGMVIAKHFQRGGTLEDLDLKTARQEYTEEMDTGKKVAQDLKKDAASAQTSSDETIEKIRKLAELRDQGILTAEEFQDLKVRLLAAI
ncbi:MAG: DUF697 domain-containing protein [Saprospiraceae bacterium]|nr:DUF697 domain-containing protein [Saprospiraceae bacterium]